ncbi:MAG TPA: hypothetical protein VH442_15385 [Micromonosporaceae bacterium]|jgi:uncharacterized protein YegP (UPF0339 family)
MTTYVLTTERPDGWHWEVVRTARSSADVVLTAKRGYADEEACRTAVEQIPYLLSTARLIRARDGSWRWACFAYNGDIAIESAPFKNADACRSHLAGIKLTMTGIRPKAYAVSHAS